MTRKTLSGLRAMGLVAFALALAAPVALAGDEVAPDAAGQRDGALERAIEAVYPALVQIHVLTLEHMGGRERKFEAAGSGAIISADGYVVTNHHVAGKAAAIRCVLSTRAELEAKLVGTDVLADIAVLKLDLAGLRKDAPPLAVARFGRSADLKIGDTILAMGCPLALSQSVTKGIVANLDLMTSRFVGGSFILDGEDVGSLVKWIGHDAQIQPGNSGGPLVNMAGEIVGVNEIGLGTIGGAIPSDLVKNVVRDLIAHGKVKRPWIGAGFQPMLKDSSREGVLVSDILPDSPAKRGGLEAGDIVIAIDDAPVRVRFREELPALNAQVLSKLVGAPVKFRVLRGGAEREVTIVTELRDDAKGKEIELVQWGLTVREITTMAAEEMQRPDRRGALVGSSREGPAAKAEPAIQPGDVIVAVGGKPVENVESLTKITAEITDGKPEPVPTLVAFERRSEHLLTVVEVGIKTPQAPVPEATKAWFPAATEVVSRKLAAALGLKIRKGVRITQLYPESEAEKAGFAVGDILTHVDGQLIEASEQQEIEVFDQMIHAYKIGATPEFTVVRDGKTMKISLVLSEAPKPEREFKEFEDVVLEFKARDVSYFDRVDRRWSKDVAGALISHVETGGWAAFAGLGTGDLIQAIDGKTIADVKSLEASMRTLHEKKPKHVTFLVRRGIHTQFIELEPTWPEHEPAPSK